MYYDSGRSNDKRSRRINLIKSSPLHCQNAKFKIFGVSPFQMQIISDYLISGNWLLFILRQIWGLLSKTCVIIYELT